MPPGIIPARSEAKWPFVPYHEREHKKRACCAGADDENGEEIKRKTERSGNGNFNSERTCYQSGNTDG